MPLWRRRTRHGRVLSLYDLVADDIDLLTHSTAGGGVFADERLNAVLRGFNPPERVVVFTYAENDGTTWSEAAAGATDPEAFGERVRRKVKRIAAEQRRRRNLLQTAPPAS
ncbi:hypothetical protein ACFY1B_49545 [Streptomyces mirabilis]|uniref:hypothetical protein n=1 Tax=Streptomyces mirabilis TaxID=68239 RepID=UPI00367F9EA5